MRALFRYAAAVITALVLWSGICRGQNVPEVLRQGDIVFIEVQSSDVERAIASVTYGIEGYNFTHVGIAVEGESGLTILEAVPPRVAETLAADFFAPTEGSVKCWAIGRLKSQFRELIVDAICEGRKLIGSEYDHAYTLGDDKYYCSEFIYEILKKANGGEDVFELNVMTFVSPTTGTILPEWIEYYKKLGVAIPEGELGINPGAMSRSDVIDIIKTGKSVFSNTL